MLCEKCQEREASCHTTTVTDGGAISTALCEVCFASTAEPAVRELHAAGKTARCRYCDGQACCGGMDPFETSAAGQPMKFMCSPCSDEFFRYWQQQLEQVPQDLPQQEQMAKIKALLEEAERHMEQWVTERDSG